MKHVIKTCFCLLMCSCAMCQVKLPSIIRDSMILQRDAVINIWGWASKGEKINIQFNGKKYKTFTGNNGKWKLQIEPQHAGGPYTMEIAGKNKIILHEILVGDVWFCSGQSNMVHQMRLHSERYANEIANANYTAIRQFWIPNVTDLQQPLDSLPNSYWKSANPQDVLDFSAVAYFFAKDLYEKYHVPIGIINASWGGIPIEAMMSEESLKIFPSIINTIEKNKDTAYIHNIINKKNFNKYNDVDKNDIGLTSTTAWYDSAYLPKEWRRINVPGYWEDQGVKNLDGVVWYRKEIDVPASMPGKTAKIFLGRIVDADVLYINSKRIGNTTYMYPQRRYNVPADILKPGKNLLVVRVINYNGKGGFVPDKPYCLTDGADTIDLKGYWQYKVGEVFSSQNNVDNNFTIQYQPTACYNAMIAPVTNYSIKGFVWYQGEANTSRSAEYVKLQPALISDWRNKWNEGDIPFLYVQLPGFGDYNYLPSESDWAALREAQLKCLSVSNTAIAVAIDLGEWNDIHPDRKKEVGDRLALAAEKIAYHENIIYSGPVYQSSNIKGNKIIISFTNVGSGLITNDGEDLQEFAIAGDDKKFVWANAKIEGDTVIVWSDKIASPKYVRYAWADDPVNANLYNKEGLPASPFATGE